MMITLVRLFAQVTRERFLAGVRQNVSTQRDGSAKSFRAVRTSVAIFRSDFQVHAAHVFTQVGLVFEPIPALIAHKGGFVEVRHHVVFEQTLVDKVKSAKVAVEAALGLEVSASVVNQRRR